MPLFFATWADRYSLIVDADDEAGARELAEEFQAAPPLAVTRINRAPFVFAEVWWGDVGDGDEEELQVTPLDDVLDVLERLEDASEEAAPAAVVEAPACGAELEDEASGAVYVCQVRGAHRRHVGTSADGDAAEWDEEEGGAT